MRKVKDDLQMMNFFEKPLNIAVIFDQEIASNQQVYQVHLIPENSKDIERLFVRLKTILNILWQKEAVEG